MNKSKLNSALLATGVAAGLFALFTTIELHRSSTVRDNFKFLRGHGAIADTVLPGVETPDPHTSQPTECRVYSWNEPYEKVLNLATEELGHAGFRVDRSKSYWTKPDHSESVMISEERRESSNAILGIYKPGPHDSRWVTVYISNIAPSTWITSLRVLVARP